MAGGNQAGDLRALANQGASVWAVGRTRETLAATVEGCSGRGRAYVANLTDDEQVSRLARDIQQEAGRVDVLVHSAGVISYGSLAEASVEALDSQYKSNVRLPYQVSQALLPLIRKRPGQIVFVNSSIVFGGARIPHQPVRGHQHAVKALADTLRQEVNADSTRALCTPGRTATTRQSRMYAKENKPYRSELLLQPEEIATMVTAALSLPPTAG